MPVHLQDRLRKRLPAPAPVELREAIGTELQPARWQIAQPQSKNLGPGEVPVALQPRQERINAPFAQRAQHPGKPERLVAPHLHHIERKSVVGEQERAAVPGPPPVRAAARLYGDVEQSKLGVEFLEVGVVVVLGRPEAQRMGVTDVFRINSEGKKIGELHPATEIGLDLLAVRVVLAHPVFAEPDAPMTDREGIPFDLGATTKADRVSRVRCVVASIWSLRYA